jgi:hypothetical protein
MKDAKQKFSYMEKINKEKVRGDMAAVVRKDFEFKRLSYDAFAFRAGYGIEVSADDMARCLLALIEDRARSNGFDEDTRAADEGFTRAYQLLTSNDPSLLKSALNVAMAHTRIMTQETINIVQGGLVQPAGDFRFVTIELHDDSADNLNDNDNDRTNFFSSPTSVVLLAKHVINAHQGTQKWLKGNGKPLVLAVSRKGKALVVGVPCPEVVGDVLQNAFGRLFVKTIKEMGVDSSPDRFLDSFIAQIDSSQVQRFLLLLSEVIRERSS